MTGIMPGFLTTLTPSSYMTQKLYMMSGSDMLTILMQPTRSMDQEVDILSIKIKNVDPPFK